MRTIKNSVARKFRYLVHKRKYEDAHPLFDAEHYLCMYPDVSAGGFNAWQHYLEFGQRQDRQPFPLFDPEYYRSQFSDADFEKIDVFDHFVAVGSKSRISPHPLFDIEYYEEKCRTSFETTEDALLHFLLQGWKGDITCSPLFDVDYYCLQANQHSMELGNPVIHYLQTWRTTGFRPFPLFDSDLYLELIGLRHNQVTNPLAHYIKHWKDLLGLDTGFFFDADYFSRQRNLDVNSCRMPLLVCWETLCALGARTAGQRQEGQTGDSSCSSNFKLSAVTERDVDVTIAIVTHNNSSLVASLLNSIWNNTSGVSYEVLVIDSGSTDLHLQRLQAIEGDFTLISLGRNLGYSEGMNVAASQARGRIFCAMSEDQVVTPNWLLPMCELLEKNCEVGAVGPQLLYPDGRLQAGKIVTTRNHIQIGIGCKWPYEINRTEEDSDCDLVNNATVRLQDLQKIGGLDFRYEPFYYENLELCDNLRENGKAVVCSGASQVFHYLSASTRRSSEMRLKTERVVEVNRHIFCANRQFRKRSTPLYLPPCDNAHAPGTLIIFGNYPTCVSDVSRLLITSIHASSGFERVIVALPSRCSRFRMERMARNHGLDINSIQFELITWDECKRVSETGKQISFLALDAVAETLVRAIAGNHQPVLSLRGFQPQLASQPLAPVVVHERHTSDFKRSKQILVVGKACGMSDLRDLCKLVQEFQALHFECPEASRYGLHIAFHVEPELKSAPGLLAFLEGRYYADIYFYPNPTYETLVTLMDNCRFAIDISSGVSEETSVSADLMATFLEAVTAGCSPIMHRSTADAVNLPANFPTWSHLPSLRQLLSSALTESEAILEERVSKVSDAIECSALTREQWIKNFWSLEIRSDTARLVEINQNKERSRSVGMRT